MNLTRVLFVLGMMVIVVLLGSTVLMPLLTFQGCEPSSKVTIINSQPTIEKLEKLAHLVTMRVSIGDVIVSEGNRYRGSWIIKGDALIAVDMSQAKVAIIDEKAKIAKVSLPLPHVFQPRVDHNKTMMYSLESNSWVNYVPFTSGSPDRLREAAMKAAQETIEKTANSSEHIREAQKRAEELVKGFYTEFGWNIEIEWPTETDLK